MTEPGGDKTDVANGTGPAEPVPAAADAPAPADVEAVFLSGDPPDEEGGDDLNPAAAFAPVDDEPALVEDIVPPAEDVAPSNDGAVLVPVDEIVQPADYDVAPSAGAGLVAGAPFAADLPEPAVQSDSEVPPASIFDAAPAIEPPPAAPDPWDLLAAEPEAEPAPTAAVTSEAPPEPPLADLAPIVLDDEPPPADTAPAGAVDEDDEDEAPDDDGLPADQHAGDGEAEEDEDEDEEADAAYEPAPLSYEAARADAVAAVVAGRSDRWTIPVMCVGICLVACCVLIPAADANRRLAYDRQRLQVELDSLRRQVEVNERFLGKVADDPNLAERLAQRQLRVVREGSKVLELDDLGGDEMSPYHLVTVAPPPPAAPYESKGGLLARLCYNPKSRLYVMGLGLLMIAAGLVMNAQPKQS